MLKLICLLAWLLFVQASYSMELLRALGCNGCAKWEESDVAEPVTVNLGAIVKTYDGCRWKIGFKDNKANFEEYNEDQPAIKLNTFEFEYGYAGHKRPGCEVVVNGKRYLYSFDKIKTRSDWNIC